MDISTSDSSMMVISPDKVLRRELSTLSKCMPSCMVQQISECLCRSRALTDYEVQVIRAGATDVNQASCLLRTLLLKGRAPCLLFFQCLNSCSPALFHKVTRGSVKVTDEAHHHAETATFSEAPGTGPPFVVKIYNSSLRNCIIGSNNSLCCLRNQTDVALDVEETPHESHRRSPEATEAPNVEVECSNVEYVNIGDNNYMSTEGSLDSEEETDPEETESVPENEEME